MWPFLLHLRFIPISFFINDKDTHLQSAGYVFHSSALTCLSRVQFSSRCVLHSDKSVFPAWSVALTFALF